MTSYRRWLVLGAAVSLVGVLVAGYGLVAGTFTARSYVRGHYARSVGHDIGREAVAYTSSLPPSRVTRDVTGAFHPSDRYADASGTYLRFGDDSVVIRPLAAGSVILLEKMGTAYPRYHGIVGSAWGWSRGNTSRGGGPGAGK
ncbi:DUF4247 domain-containing protein [Plantactinospora sp. KBS50]|uniref:DUF4247 domain-containing protein n=1 Tax=Plantactinospora sp. KBS50 TaxID=2024580 RepID=UPI000BAADA41|nr:DUF4247 domain-containing protein [Plantactinospora sp. KBS50]ASW53030.1 hypothetical protein CIK06_00740 [Plantactinospora sp. KBS50]